MAVSLLVELSIRSNVQITSSKPRIWKRFGSDLEGPFLIFQTPFSQWINGYFGEIGTKNMARLHFMSQSFLRIWCATGFDALLSTARHPATSGKPVFWQKMYPRNSKQSFSSPKGKKYSVRLDEHTQVNPSHVGPNPRIHKYLVLVKQGNTQWTHVTRKWH